MNAGLSAEVDCALTAKGERQAREAGRRLREVLGEGRLSEWVGVASPYRRAMQTAAIISEATGLSFEIDEAVREWGRPAEVRGRSYEEEPIAAVIERVREFMVRRRQQRVVVVTHGTPVELLTQLSRAAVPKTEGRFWEGVENCCLRRVTISP